MFFDFDKLIEELLRMGLPIDELYSLSEIEMLLRYFFSEYKEAIETGDFDENEAKEFAVKSSLQYISAYKKAINLGHSKEFAMTYAVDYTYNEREISAKDAGYEKLRELSIPHEKILEEVIREYQIMGKNKKFLNKYLAEFSAGGITYAEEHLRDFEENKHRPKYKIFEDILVQKESDDISDIYFDWYQVVYCGDFLINVIYLNPYYIDEPQVKEIIEQTNHGLSLNIFGGTNGKYVASVSDLIAICYRNKNGEYIPVNGSAKSIEDYLRMIIQLTYAQGIEKDILIKIKQNEENKFKTPPMYEIKHTSDIGYEKENQFFDNLDMTNMVISLYNPTKVEIIEYSTKKTISKDEYPPIVFSKKIEKRVNKYSDIWEEFIRKLLSFILK